MKVCSICNKPHYGNGYCKSHYRKDKKWGEPNYKYTPQICTVEGCGKGPASKGLCKKHSYRLRTYGDPLAKTSRETVRYCKVSSCENLYASKGFCHKHYSIFRNYKITVDEYERRLKYSDGRCDICGEPCEQRGFLSLDHNHKTGEVRGMLCSMCNVGLGSFKDDPAVLDGAAKYLMLWSQIDN